MKLEEEVIAWAKRTRPLWQRDALRRLYDKGAKLDEEDYHHLFRMMKVEYGFQDEGVVSPEPLDLHHVPSTPDTGKMVGIKSVSGLQNVNRIIEGQTLEFVCPGITVVYGANGSGKSGYARVLKKACRARDAGFDLLPDVTYTASIENQAKAKIVAIDNNSSTEIDWTDSETASELLGNVSVFDTGCASVYLQREQDIAYLPYLLQVMEALANDVIPEVSSRLQSELDRTQVDYSLFEHLQRDTEVGNAIGALDENTDLDSLRRLARLSGKEQARLQELQQILSALNPQNTARELRRSAGRIRAVADRLRSIENSVSSQRLQEIEALMVDSQKAADAVKVAAEALHAGEELLRGTGNDSWKEMYLAARRFSIQHAYPENRFPDIAEDASCPLCQQPLTSSAIDRLKRFDAFVFQEVSKRGEQADRKFLGELQELREVNLSLNLSSEQAEELEELDTGVTSVLRDWEAKVESVRTEAVKCLEEGQSPRPLNPNVSPVGRLRSVAARQLKSSLRYLRAAKPETTEQVKRELNELEDRQSLSQLINSVVGVVETLRKRAKLLACKQDLTTRPISNKSREFGNRIINERLQAALDDEFRKLSLNHISTELKTRTDRGQTRYQVTLHSAASVPVTNVLSEGEQRALALASFFAELKLSRHRGGVVFDDPVTSLDHVRRTHLAKRMVEEAMDRQVILFTHDSVFLSQLLEQLGDQSVEHRVCFLEWENSKPGKVNAGLPWMHQNYKERIDQLEKDAAELARNWPPYPSDADIAEICRHYGRFRATIERVVQDVILNQVVQRYRDYIRVKNLEKVIGFSPDEFGEIYSLYDKCSGLVEAHDPPTGKNATPASAQELREDINRLKNLIDRVKARQKNAASS